MFGFLSFLFTVGGGILFGPIGALAGSLLASALFKGDQDTGRLDNVRVQGANYGDPIHIVHGAMRVGGTIVWPRDLELKDTTRDGGSTHMWFDPFGWFDQDLPDIHYYSATWAVLLCRGPIDEVRRIFFNGELVFSTHPDDDQQFRSDSMAMLSRDANGIEIMLGTEDQEPSEFMSKYHKEHFNENITDVPGYRGRVLVIFKNFSLEAYGNRLPVVTAEVLRKRSVETADSWVDISDALGPNHPSLRNHAESVAFGKLWIIGGFVGGDVNNTDLAVLKGSMSNEGRVVFGSGPYLPQPREELQAVTLITYEGYRRIERLFVMGGYGPQDNAMRTYYADPFFGDMVLMLSSETESWAPHPILVDPTGFESAVGYPFPRDTFTAVYWWAPRPYGPGIWVFGGRNTSDHPLGWEGHGSAFRDLWFFNGTTWFLETPVRNGESEDSGLGYRIGASAVVFNDRLYAGGGMVMDQWASHVPMRDIRRMSFALMPPRFSEVASADILADLDWPDREGWYISNLVVFRDKMVATVSQYFTYVTYHFLESPDGVVWDLAHLHKYTIAGTGDYRYIVAGDRVADIVQSTTMHDTDTGGKTTISAVWSEYRFYDSENGFSIFRPGQWVNVTGFANPENNGRFRIVSVASDGSYITVADGDDRPVDEDAGNDVRIRGGYLTATVFNSSVIRQEIVSSAEYDAETDRTTILVGQAPLASGTFYVDRLSGILATFDDYIPKPVTLTNFNSSLVFFGGEALNGTCLVYQTQATATQPESIPLSDIVQEICLESRLTADQFDVSELTETLHGFVYDRSVSKSILEDLRKYGFFDYAEIDGKIKFLTRGRSPVAALPSTELGAYASDSRSSTNNFIPDKIKIIRQPEKSMPSVLEVEYFDVDRNYEKSIQRAVRQHTESQRQITVELPIAMDADKAAQIAHVLLHTYWTEQDSIPIFLNRKYLHLTPCDVITLTNGLESYTARITQIEEGDPGIISVKAVREDTLIYDTPQIGISQPSLPYVNRLKRLNTNLVFLDIPILSEHDDDHGLYIGAYPVDAEDEEDWDGVWVQARQETEDTHVTIGSLNRPLVYGTADHALGDGSPSTWDRAHTITVTLARGNLSSSTEDRVKRGENVCMLGDEIFQFVTAEDLGNNKYKLSTLLRGRFGTEWATGTHVEGEAFYFLSRESLFRARWSSHAIGKPIQYRAVPFYRDESNYAFVEFTGYAKGKKPYAPAHLNAVRDGNGTWRIEWMRRARAGGVLPLGHPVPLNESFEQYAVEFIQNDVILHTEYVSVIALRPTMKPFMELPVQSTWKRTSTGESRLQYGQNHIYGGPVNSIHVRVYQISETVGRGYPAEGIFSEY